MNLLNNYSKVFGLLFTGLALTSCGFIPRQAPTDLHFVKAQTVNWVDMSEKIKKSIKLTDKSPAAQFIQVTFSSNHDLLDFARSNDITSYMAFYCRDWAAYEKGEEAQKNSKTGYSGPVVPMMNGSMFMYDGNIPLDKYELKEEKTSGIYQLYLDVRRTENKNSASPSAYDLQKNPDDVCFQMGGGVMWVGGGTPSNIVTIPKEAIAAALNASK